MRTGNLECPVGEGSPWRLQSKAVDLNRHAFGDSELLAAARRVGECAAGCRVFGTDHSKCGGDKRPKNGNIKRLEKEQVGISEGYPT